MSFVNILKKKAGDAVYYQQNKHAIRLLRQDSSQLKIKKLTMEEKKEVNELWYRIKGFERKRDKYLGWELYKTICGFDSKFVPEHLMFPYVLSCLNDRLYIEAFQHKALYDFVFRDVPRPSTLVKGLNGTLYDSENNVLSEEKSINILIDSEKFLVKPTYGSERGMNIRLLEGEKFNKIIFDEIKKKYKGNFIFQNVLKQSNQTSKFSKCSLNTFRINTISLNGKVSRSSSVLRIGQGDSLVDNVYAGGIMIGINSDGSLNEYGIDTSYKLHYKNNGVEFKNESILDFDKVIDFAVDLHKNIIPFIGLAAWDIALDECNNPELIEVNLYWPGTETEQISSGHTIFGNRTEEIIDYVYNYNSTVQTIFLRY